MPRRRAPLATSLPSIELKDMTATRSPSWAPSPWKALAARFALRFSEAKLTDLSPRITAGLSGRDSAWLRRKSITATTPMLGAKGIHGWPARAGKPDGYLLGSYSIAPGPQPD